MTRTNRYLPSIVLCALCLAIAGCGPASTPASSASPTVTLPPVSTVQAAAATAAPPTGTASPTNTLVVVPATGTRSPAGPATATASPATAAATAPAVAPGDWTTYHRDNTRTGYVPDMPDPQKLTPAWNTALDGAVYAEPLVVGGHLLAATEQNTVYSLDAHTGKIEWQTHLGNPVSRSQLPCGNINPLGITGTPVYDAASGLVFAVAEVAGPAHVLVGLDARSGEVRLRRAADPPGMQPLAHQQRAALALSQGMVYIAYGGLYGDCGNYHGWVVASRTDGSGPLLAYQVPTSREGGIWAAAGPVVDAAGRIFVSVGNGAETAGAWDHSDSVLRLSPTLALEDGFAPAEWKQDNAADADLGSLSPVLLPGGFVFAMGKSGTGYVTFADRLGGVGGQALARFICHAYGGAAIVGAAAFVPCNEGVQQVQVGAGPSLTIGWRAAQVPGSPVAGGHTVYALDRSGNLDALDMATGAVRASAGVGDTSRFATPTLFENYVFVGTMTGIVAVTIA